MKRFFVLMMTISITLCIPCAIFADNGDTALEILSAAHDNRTDKIIVECNIKNPAQKQRITLTVYPKDANHTDYDNIRRLDQFLPNPDENGNFTVSFKLKKDMELGEYTVRMGGTGIKTPDSFGFELEKKQPVIAAPEGDTITVPADSGTFKAIIKLKNKTDDVTYIGVEKLDD